MVGWPGAVLAGELEMLDRGGQPGGGDIFKLSRILGHSDVKMTLRYAHLAPQAFEPDDGRLAFKVPTEAAVVRMPMRGADGKLCGTAKVLLPPAGVPGEYLTEKPLEKARGS